jgi:hypothetical protein
MKTPASDPRRPPSLTLEGTQTLKRRGLLAATAALVAGLVAKFSEVPLVAGTDGDVVLGAVSSTTAQTAVRNTGDPATVGTTAALVGIRSTSILQAFGGTIGVYGVTDLPGATGVQGSSQAANGIGVSGFGSSTGVEGFGGTGVLGQSTNGNAILGLVPSGSMSNAIAVYGQNYSTYTGPTPGAGGFAVYGLSAKGHGLVGATATAGGAAVVGATNGVAGAYAAAFYGPVIVGGAFTVVGGPKSAAVPHPDGSHRRLYCMESPESWFEDFGRGQLACGQAHVMIDPDFAALVNVDDYQVFLTEYGERSDLYVADQTPTGFRVQAKDDTATGRFGWRIVARRKDIAGERLASVTIPPEPTLPPPVADRPEPDLSNGRIAR